MLKKNVSLARKGLKRSRRIINFTNRVTPEFDDLIRNQAEEEGCLIVEMMEKYQAAYLEKVSKHKE